MGQGSIFKLSTQHAGGEVNARVSLAQAPID
jgi:hypothetical protein